MNTNLKRSLILQAVLGIVLIVGFGLYGFWQAAIYGAAISFANVLMLAITFNKANAKAAENPKSGILVLYMSAVLRFALMAVLFIVGLALLRLEPLPVIITFMVMTVGQMFNLKGKRRLTD